MGADATEELICFISPQKWDNLASRKHDYLNLYMYCKITTVNSRAHKNNSKLLS